jgi:hypothetical protein
MCVEWSGKNSSFRVLQICTKFPLCSCLNPCSIAITKHLILVSL